MVDLESEKVQLETAMGQAQQAFEQASMRLHQLQGAYFQVVGMMKRRDEGLQAAGSIEIALRALGNGHQP